MAQKFLCGHKARYLSIDDDSPAISDSCSWEGWMGIYPLCYLRFTRFFSFRKHFTAYSDLTEAENVENATSPSTNFAGWRLGCQIMFRHVLYIRCIMALFDYRLILLELLWSALSPIWLIPSKKAEKEMLYLASMILDSLRVWQKQDGLKVALQERLNSRDPPGGNLWECVMIWY